MLGKVKIDVPQRPGEKSYQDNARRILRIVQEQGFEGHEIRGGIEVHMDVDEASRLAEVLTECDLHRNNVRNNLLAAIHREPAEALIKEMS